MDSLEFENFHNDPKSQYFYNLPAHSIKIDMENARSEKELKNLKHGEFKVCLDCADMLANIKDSSNETLKVAHAVQEEKGNLDKINRSRTRR